MSTVDICDNCGHAPTPPELRGNPFDDGEQG